MSTSVIAEPPRQGWLVQLPKQGRIIQQQSHPEWDATGLHAGSFNIFPEFSYTGEYNDNIFSQGRSELKLKLNTGEEFKARLKAGKEEDFLSIISPAVSVRSNWGKHALNLFADVDLGRYAKFTEEDYDDWKVRANGRIDVSNNIQLLLNGRFKQGHQFRYSLEDSGAGVIRGAEPTVFTEAGISPSYNHRFGRFLFDMDFDFVRNNYDDVSGIRVGNIEINRTINNDDRDRNEYTLGLTGSYQINPSYSSFLGFSVNRREYDDLQDVSGFDRTSEGYEISTGMSFDFGGMVFGDFSLGYRVQDYKNPLVDIDSPVFDASLNWNVTALTTINAESQRSYHETTNIDFSGYFTTGALLSVNHELQRNILLNVGLEWTDYDYEGHASNELDQTVYSASIEMTYKFNKYLYSTIQYNYFDRKVSQETPLVSGNKLDATGKTQNNIFFFRIQTQL